MNREVQNEHEPEVLSKDEEAVSQLVASLEPVEAPANFERRVMARIAEGEPDPPSLFAVPAFAYAVPLALVLMLGAFFVFKLRQPSAAQPEYVANPSTIPVTVQHDSSYKSPVEPQESPEAPAVAKSRSDNVESAPSRKSTRPVANRSSKKAGGSTDFGQDQAKQPMPQGMSSSSIPIRDILTQLGMTVEYKGAWLVNEVKSDSPAESSGIKAGDVVVALGSQKLNANSEFRDSGSIKTISVRRDGSVIPLKIQLSKSQ